MAAGAACAPQRPLERRQVEAADGRARLAQFREYAKANLGVADGSERAGDGAQRGVFAAQRVAAENRTQQSQRGARPSQRPPGRD